MINNVLYFRDRMNELREVSKDIGTMKEVTNDILEYVTKINPKFKIYYIRRWKKDSDIWFDVGSYSEFIVLKGEEPEYEQEPQETNTNPTKAERKRLYYRPE